jgi:CCR4-NOT transcription complex subunit 6
MRSSSGLGGSNRRSRGVLAPYVPYAMLRELGSLSNSSTSSSASSSVPLTGLNLSNAGLSVLRLPSNLLFMTELYVQKNSLAVLPSSIGLLRALRVLDVSYNSLTALPSELGNLFELRDLNVSCNRLTELAADVFGRLHKLEVCQHEGNNLVSPPLAILSGGAYSIFRYCCDSMAAPAPPERVMHHFIPEAEQAHMISQGCVKLNVLCYNVLAELYATVERHGYCPMWALAWSYRKMRIISEIIGLSADVICLQEVETQQ